MISPSRTSKRSSWKRWRCNGPPPPPGWTTVSDLSTSPEADASTSTMLWMPSPSAFIALIASSSGFGVDSVYVFMVAMVRPRRRARIGQVADAGDDFGRMRRYDRFASICADHLTLGAIAYVRTGMFASLRLLLRWRAGRSKVTAG